MSRTRAQRRSAVAHGEEAGLLSLEDVVFHPGALCGGKLSAAEVRQRSQRCTEEQLASLEASAEFQAWEQEQGFATRSNPVRAAAHKAWAAVQRHRKPALAAVAAATLLLLAVVAGINAWALAGPHIRAPVSMHSAPTATSRPAASPPAARAPQPQPVTPERQQQSEQQRREALATELATLNAQLQQEKGRAQQLLVEVKLAKNELQAAEEQHRQQQEQELQRREALAADLAAQQAHLQQEKTRAQQLLLKIEQDKKELQAAQQRQRELREQEQQAVKLIAAPKAATVPGLLSMWGVSWLPVRGPSAALFGLEIGALLLASVLVVGSWRSQGRMEQARRHFLAAAAHQTAALAKTEDAYAAAKQAREVAEGAAAEGAAEDLRSAAAGRAEWQDAGAQVLQLVSSPVKAGGKGRAPLADLSANAAGGGSASEAATPGAFAKKLTDRVSELRRRATEAERATVEAKNSADAAKAAAAEAVKTAEDARREQAMSEQKVSETLTDNELLKERLAGEKRALQAAARAQEAAKGRELALQARLQETQRGLEAVQRERSALTQEVAALRSAGAAASQRIRALESASGNWEAQVDQLAASLAEEASRKSRAEAKVAQLEQDLSSLGVLAEALRCDKAELEGQLAEAREAQAELVAASWQLAAAPAAGGHGVKEAALQLVASAEKRMEEQQALDDLQLAALPPPSRLSSRGGSTLPADRVASSYSLRLDRISRLLAGEPEASSSGDLPASPITTSAALVSGNARKSPGTLSAWLTRTSDLFSTVDRLLTQELPGGKASPVALPAPRTRRVHVRTDVPLLAAADAGSGGQQGWREAIEEANAADVARQLAELVEVAEAGGEGAAGAAAASEKLLAAQRGVEEAAAALTAAEGRVGGVKAHRGELLAALTERQVEVEGAEQGVEAALADMEVTKAAAAAAVQALKQAEAAAAEAEERQVAADDAVRAVGGTPGGGNGRQGGKADDAAVALLWEACMRAADELQARQRDRLAAATAQVEALKALDAAEQVVAQAAQALTGAEAARKAAAAEELFAVEQLSAATAQCLAAHNALLQQQAALADAIAAAEELLRSSAEAITSLMHIKFFGAPRAQLDAAAKLVASASGKTSSAASSRSE